MRKIPDKIQVALVCTSVNALGGKSTHLMNMYKYLNGAGVGITLICCSIIENELRDFMLVNGVRKEDFIIIPHRKKLFLLPFFIDLVKLIKDRNINVVHLFQIQSDILVGIPARLAGVKNIISQFESKIIEDNISIFKQLFYRTVNFFIKHLFKRTVVVSYGLKRELTDERFRDPERTEVIHLGVDIPDIYKNRDYQFANLKNGVPVIGMVSGFQVVKGIDRFISIVPIIAKKLPKASFLIIGQGSEEKNLKEMVERLGLKDKVRFGKIPWTERVFTGLEAIDVIVMPSIREGCPYSLLEALVMARPVIASKIEGVMDIIEDEKDGLLVDTADPEEFAEKVISLCQNPDKAIALGENGRKKILTEFTIAREMDRYNALYESLFNDKVECCQCLK